MTANASKAIAESFRFVAWAQSLHRLPTVAEIVAKWDCSRASAYRYRNALADAFGIYVPTRSKNGAAGLVSSGHRATQGNRSRVCSREPA